jgi:hypothetical protein
VVRHTAKNRTYRDEHISSKYRQQAVSRFENMKAREMRAANEIAVTNIVTPNVALLEVSYSHPSGRDSGKTRVSVNKFLGSEE